MYVPQKPFLVYDTDPAAQGTPATTYEYGTDFELRSPYAGFMIDYTKGSETNVTVAVQIKLPDGTYANWLTMEGQTTEAAGSERLHEWTFTGTQKSAKALCGDTDNQPSQFLFGKTCRLALKASGLLTSFGSVKIYISTFATDAERYL